MPDPNQTQAMPEDVGMSDGDTRLVSPSRYGRDQQ
jgi:hypothetical protein